MGQNLKHKRSREKIIKNIQTPLGFFVLIVLVLEVVLSVFAGVSPPSERNIPLILMTIILVSLISVVSFMAYSRPASLYGKEVGSPKKNMPKNRNLYCGEEMFGKFFEHMNNGQKISETFRLIEESFKNDKEKDENTVYFSISPESLIEILIKNTKRWIKMLENTEEFRDMKFPEYLIGYSLITIANISVLENNNLTRGSNFIKEEIASYLNADCHEMIYIKNMLNVAMEILYSGKRDTTRY